MTNGKNFHLRFFTRGALVPFVLGEQRATVALVAVACIFLSGILTMEAAVLARKIPLLEKPLNFSGTWPPLAALAG